MRLQVAGLPVGASWRASRARRRALRRHRQGHSERWIGRALHLVRPAGSSSPLLHIVTSLSLKHNDAHTECTLIAIAG